MSELTQHLKMHYKLGTPITDANGNILAHVTPRVDTLANLLLVTDAGDGEVATASDVDAMVVYKGNPSVGVPYNRSDSVGLFTFRDSSLVVPSGAVTIPVEIGPFTEKGSFIDDVANTFIGGKLVHDTLDTKTIKAFFNVLIVSAIPASAGTYVKLDLEQEIIDAWTTQEERILPIVPVAGMNAVYDFNFVVPMPVSTNAFRFLLSTDDTTVMPCVVDVTCNYMNYEAYGYEYAL